MVHVMLLQKRPLILFIPRYKNAHKQQQHFQILIEMNWLDKLDDPTDFRFKKIIQWFSMHNTAIGLPDFRSMVDIICCSIQFDCQFSCHLIELYFVDTDPKRLPERQYPDYLHINDYYSCCYRCYCCCSRYWLDWMHRWLVPFYDRIGTISEFKHFLNNIRCLKIDASKEANKVSKSHWLAIQIWWSENKMLSMSLLLLFFVFRPPSNDEMIFVFFFLFLLFRDDMFDNLRSTSCVFKRCFTRIRWLVVDG